MTRRRAGGPLVAVMLLAAGCGPASGAPAALPSHAPAGTLRPTAALLPSSPVPVLPSLPPVALPSASPAASASPSFAEAYAVSCGGYPAASRVIALLKRKHVVGGSANLSATVGPLCSGGLRYTVFSQPG